VLVEVAMQKPHSWVQQTRLEVQDILPWTQVPGDVADQNIHPQQNPLSSRTSVRVAAAAACVEVTSTFLASGGAGAIKLNRF
jgi:hypothetical protein